MSAPRARGRDRLVAVWMLLIVAVAVLCGAFGLWLVRGRRYFELQLAAERGDVQKIAQLVKQGADVNGRQGAPPLILAASAYHTDAVETLLRYGADPNITNVGGGGTALYQVVLGSQVRPVAAEATARVLLKYGAHVPPSLISMEKDVLTALKHDPRFYQDYYTRIEPGPLPRDAEYGRVPEAEMEASRVRLARMILEAGKGKSGSGSSRGVRPQEGDSPRGK